MTFDPDWTVAPGETLKDWREENGLSARIMATLCSLERERYEAIEAGKGKITQTTACKLQQGTGIPAKFWLKFEERFRADLKAGKKWTA